MRILDTTANRIYQRVPDILKREVCMYDISVANTAKLPLSVSRGTERQRFKKAKKYSNRLRKLLDKNSNGKECTLEKFKEALDKTLGEHHIDYRIDRNVSEKAAAQIGFETGGKYLEWEQEGFHFKTIDMSRSRYVLFLELDKTGKIIKNKYSALHEARHLFDHIFNPKTVTNRTCKYEVSPSSTKPAFDGGKKELFYDAQNTFSDFLSNRQLKATEFKELAKEKLEKLDDEMAIDVLQISRDTLKTEISAYRDTLIYLFRHPIKNRKDFRSIFKVIRKIESQKRLKTANELLRERLQIARENIQTEREQLKEKAK